MKKRIYSMMIAAALCGSAVADGFKTAGDGTVYSLDKLSEIEAANVYKYVDEDDGEVIYVMYENDTIAAGDSFVMDDGVTLQFDDEVTLVIEGQGDFRLEKGSVFDSAFDDYADVSPMGVHITGGDSQTEFVNCQFYYVGLKCTSPHGLSFRNCGFYNNNGAMGQAALTLGPSGAPFVVEDCSFEYGKKPAIAGAANYYNPLTIKNCTFKHNALLNKNTPQLNLTVASSVTIDGCEIIGDTDLTMVGGIGISNFSAVEGTHITIKNCHIADNRYGIGTVGPMDIRIEGNTLQDNRYETNAMNGGSGISLYDPYQKTTAVIARNTISGNLWGVTVIGCKDVNMGQPTRSDIQTPGLNVFNSNGNGGVLYDLYNNSSNKIYAQNNTWGVGEQTEEQIETVIFHKVDDESLGEVIFMPAANTNGIGGTIRTTDKTAASVYDLAGRQRTKKNVIYKIGVVHGQKMLVR